MRGRSPPPVQVESKFDVVYALPQCLLFLTQVFQAQH